MAERAWRSLQASAAPTENSSIQAVDAEPFLEENRLPCQVPSRSLPGRLSGSCVDEEECLQAEVAAEDVRSAIGAYSQRSRCFASTLLIAVLSAAALSAWLKASSQGVQVRVGHSGRISLAEGSTRTQGAREALVAAGGVTVSKAPLRSMAEPPPESGVFGNDGVAFGAQTGADNAGSMDGDCNCAAHGCGQPFDPALPCQCNDECAEHNSCCSDFEDICTGAGSVSTSSPAGDPDASCAKFGCIGFVKDNPCQCNEGCHERNSCCWDFDDKCADSSVADVSSTTKFEGSPGSCKEYGCIDFDAAHSCQCNAGCSEHDSCCPDFDATCTTQEPEVSVPQPPHEAIASAGTSGSCNVYGCVDYDEEHDCQCNSGCEVHGSCCEDYSTTCATAPQDIPLQTPADASLEDGVSDVALGASQVPPLEKVPYFPIPVVDFNYQEACEAGNALPGGWIFVYNQGRGTDGAACGKEADYWCCRRCEKQSGCAEIVTSTTTILDLSSRTTVAVADSDPEGISNFQDQQLEEQQLNSQRSTVPPTGQILQQAQRQHGESQNAALSAFNRGAQHTRTYNDRRGNGDEERHSSHHDSRQQKGPRSQGSTRLNTGYGVMQHHEQQDSASRRSSNSYGGGDATGLSSSVGHGSCAGNCTSGYIKAARCQCYRGCRKEGSCCPDFFESCVRRVKQASRPSPAERPDSQEDDEGTVDIGDGNNDDPDPYDCSVGKFEGWRKNKREWCCMVEEVGCDEQAHSKQIAKKQQNSANATTSRKAPTTSTTKDPEADIALR